MFNKILVALDLSPMGRQVFEVGLQLAQNHAAQLFLLHVLSPQEDGYPNAGMVTSLDYSGLYSETLIRDYLQQLEAFKQKGLEWLQSLSTEATTAGVLAEFAQPLGNPGFTICDQATLWQADLIVMGRRSRSGLEEFLLGSVSNYVTHNARCSVLTVRPFAPAESAAVSPPQAQKA